MAATDVALAAIGEYVTKEGSMKQAILLMTNGSILEVKRPDNGDITLQDVQGMVGGYFEVWPVLVMWHGRLCQMLVDEEGKLAGFFQLCVLIGRRVLGLAHAFPGRIGVAVALVDAEVAEIGFTEIRRQTI